MNADTRDLARRLERLIAIGSELSSARDLNDILTHILESAMELTRADGGTLYLVRDGHLTFEIIRNRSLNIAKGGSGEGLAVHPIPLYLPGGRPNPTAVSAAAALQKRTFNLEDAYASRDFDFSGTRHFNKLNRYRSQSFLTVPMINHGDEVTGVLRLIEALREDGQGIRPFDAKAQFLVESLTSQAAVVLNNRQLVDSLQELFIAFAEAMNIALDKRSLCTHGHCRRVPILTMLLAEAAHQTQDGPLKDLSTDADRLELELASLLRDCGKIATPVHVVDGSTKLESSFDRIHPIDLRCEVVKRDARIRRPEAEVARLPDGARHLAALAAADAKECVDIDADRDFLRHVNIGGEFISDALQQRVRDIANRYRWHDPAGEDAPLLSAEEVDKLCIARGTLSADERQIINDHHIKVTIEMLEALPWPKHLKQVFEYADGHHERMDGKGYPRGLARAQMSIPARIMAIADVFEALTARDRPEKPGKTLTEALTILGRMKQEQHEPDLFDVFVREKVYLRYAREYLEPGQIDAVDPSRILGYSGTV